MIKVLIADDHPIVRDVLLNLLDKAGEIEIVAMESDGEQAVNQTILYRPDVAVIDISMPTLNGIQVTKQIRVQSPETRVLIISGYDSREYIERSLEAGALGYVLKEFMSEDLILGIRAIYEGRPFFSRQIAELSKDYGTSLDDSPTVAN